MVRVTLSQQRIYTKDIYIYTPVSLLVRSWEQSSNRGTKTPPILHLLLTNERTIVRSMFNRCMYPIYYLAVDPLIHFPELPPDRDTDIQQSRGSRTRANCSNDYREIPGCGSLRVSSASKIIPQVITQPSMNQTFVIVLFDSC